MSIRSYECQTESDFYQETPFDHAPETKDLITDILQYLKDNGEARERFNKGYFKKIYKSSGIFDSKPTFDNQHIFYGWIEMDYLKKDKGYLRLHTVELQYFLLHALSSPNGKPICGFLEREVLKKSKFTDMINNTEESIEDDVLVKVNNAETLYNIFTKCLYNGEGFEESYNKVNEKYNEIL